MRRLLEKRHGRADVLLAISQGTAEKLRQFLGYKAAGIVRPASSEKFYRRDETEIAKTLLRYRIRRPYLLSIGNADATPHKNTELLIRVFRDLRREGQMQGHTLVLGGPKSDQFLQNLWHATGTADSNIITLGYVDGDDLPALYSGADVFVFPSVYEGFGIPVLEARACQTKTVTTDAPEFREAGDDWPIYVTPDERGVRRGILDALAGHRPSGRAALWTWKSSAEILADALAPRE
jgi:glycosyltransferase involved in cell wall biosynthesis